jgi:hypothetical protein
MSWIQEIAMSKKQNQSVRYLYVLPAVIFALTLLAACSRAITTAISRQDPSAEAQAQLKSIQKPAVWPTSEGAVRIAEVLQGSERLKVVTPAQVEGAINKRGLPASLDKMTETDLLSAFRAVCKETGADAAIAAKPGPTTMSVPFVGMTFPTYTMTATLIVYAAKPDAILVREPVETSGSMAHQTGPFSMGMMPMATGMNPSSASPEHSASMGEAVAQRVLELVD